MTNEQTKQKMHPYAQVLQWVAEGKEIEDYVDGTWSKCSYNAVLSCALHGAYFGKILEPQDFRLKPEPKPDVVQYVFVMLDCNEMLECSHSTLKATPKDNLKVVFDGESRKIKSVEII